MPSNDHVFAGELKFSGKPVFTPIIETLFSPFNLGENSSSRGNTCFYSYQSSADGDVAWEQVMESIQDNADVLGIELPDDADDGDISEWMRALAEKFSVNDPDILARINKLENNYQADPFDVFDLAIRFNDGHNLEGIVQEGCWYSDKAALNEFGGSAQVVTPQIRMSVHTQTFLDLAASLDKAIASNNQAAATTLVAGAVNKLLDAIQDKELRQKIADALVNDGLGTTKSSEPTGPSI